MHPDDAERSDGCGYCHADRSCWPGEGTCLQGTEGSGNGGGTEANLPLPAALGLGPDEENRLVVNEQLKQLVETRRQWVNTVGKIFDEKQKVCCLKMW